MSSVRLRPPTTDDIAWLDEAESTVENRGIFNDFGVPRIPHAERAKKRFIGDNHGKLIVERVADGERVGTVDWRPNMYGPNQRSRAWQVGISLLPAARGQGYGAEALRLLADYLFEHTDANRVEGSTDIENVASQRALEKAGYTREGIIRGAQFRHEAMHDLVLYSRLRGDG